MVPNKICRSQNFGDAGCLLDHYCEPGFHGGVPGSENQPARCDAQGHIGSSPAPEPFGFDRLHRGPSSRMSASGISGSSRSVNTGCKPPENSSGSTNGTQRHLTASLKLLCHGFEWAI